MSRHFDGWFYALIFFVVLQIVASVLRFWVRIFIVKKLGKDDIASFLTLLISLAYCAILIGIYVIACGKLAEDLTFDVLFTATRMALALILLYGLATMTLKIALGLLLLRILIKRWHVITIYAVMAVSVAYGIFFFFFNLFQCGNPWQFPIRIFENMCYSHPTINGIAYTHAVLCALADIIYGLLPIFYLRSANLDTRTKISVGFILGLGSAGCICTIIRIGWIHHLTAPFTTFFQTAGGISVMSAAELSIGITCMCLTTYKPLFRHYFSSSRGSGNSPQDSEKRQISAGSDPSSMQRQRRDVWLDDETSNESDPRDPMESWAAKERDAQIYSLFANPTAESKASRSTTESKVDRPPSSFSI